LLVKEAWGLPAFAALLVKLVRLDPCPSTAMAAGGGLETVVSPEVTAQSVLLNASKMSNRLSPESNTAGPLLIMTMPSGLLSVLAVAVEGRGDDARQTDGRHAI
jgi:hypothetical protein